MKRKYKIHFLVRCPKFIISKYVLLQLIRNKFWFIMIMYWHILKKNLQYEYKINLTLIFMESGVNLNCSVKNFIATILTASVHLTTCKVFINRNK